MILQIIDGHIAGYTLFGGTYDDGGVDAPDEMLDKINPEYLRHGVYAWDGQDIVLDQAKLDAALEQERKDAIRARREAECYPIINRGAAWYAMLTPEQNAELMAWYQAWLDAPETGIIPDTPDWLI